MLLIGPKSQLNSFAASQKMKVWCICFWKEKKSVFQQLKNILQGERVDSNGQPVHCCSPCCSYYINPGSIPPLSQRMSHTVWKGSKATKQVLFQLLLLSPPFKAHSTCRTKPCSATVGPVEIQRRWQQREAAKAIKKGGNKTNGSYKNVTNSTVVFYDASKDK